MKVLLVTGTPVRTDTNMGKTMQTLFSDFMPSELVQLYFSPETPNIDTCSSYYQICEKQMIKSLFGMLSVKCGGVIQPSLGVNSKIPEKNALILTRHKGTALVRWEREIIWSLTRWKNRNFIEWIEREQLEVIFFVMQDTNGASKAVTWISKKYKIPVVMFVTDDYYNDPKASKNPFRRAYYKTRKKVNQQLAMYCNTLIGCSEKAAKYFADVLKIRGGGGALYPLRRYLFSNSL